MVLVDERWCVELGIGWCGRLCWLGVHPSQCVVLVVINYCLMEGGGQPFLEAEN